MENVHSLSFENFILEINEKVNDCYLISLIESPWGEAKIMVPADKFIELKKLNDALIEFYARGDPRGTQILSRQLGTRLFDTIIQGDIRRRYDKSLGFTHKEEAVLRILFRVTSKEWADLLLELMRDCDVPYLGDQYLCRGRKTVLARYPNKKTPDYDHLVPLHKLKILVAISTPVDYAELSVRREQEQLRKSIQPKAELAMRFLSLSSAIEINYLEKATYASLENKMRSYSPHVIRFIGHTEQVEEKAGLILEKNNGESDFVSDERLFRLFRISGEPLQLVYLNACKSFDICQQLVSYYGMSVVIGTKMSVHDSVAIDFTAQLYASILGGQPIDYAMREARERTLRIHDYEWMAYVLAMHNKTGYFFDFLQTSELIEYLEEIWEHIVNLGSKVKEVYETAVQALVKLGKAVVGLLVSVMDALHLSLQQREGAVDTLGQIMAETNDVLPVESLVKIVRNNTEPVSIRKKAIEALGESHQSENRRALLQLMNELTTSNTKDELSASDLYETLDETTKELLDKIKLVDGPTKSLKHRVNKIVSQRKELEGQRKIISNTFNEYKRISENWSNQLNELAKLANRGLIPDMVVEQVQKLRILCNQLAEQKRDKHKELNGAINDFTQSMQSISRDETDPEVHQLYNNLRSNFDELTSRAAGLNIENEIQGQLQPLNQELDSIAANLQINPLNPVQSIQQISQTLRPPELLAMEQRDQENIHKLDGAKIITPNGSVQIQVVSLDSIATNLLASE